MKSAYPVPGVAAVIFNHQKEICLVQRNQEPAIGTWTFPGGKLEWGESIRDGLKREIREECSIEIALLDPDHPLCVVERIGVDDVGFPHHYIILDYLCRHVGGSLQAGSDVGDARWVAYEDMGKFTSNEKTLQVAEMAWRKVLSGNDLPCQS